MATQVETNEELSMSFQAKDGSNVTLRPVRIEDASDIISGVEAIVRKGEYLQKESPRSLEEEQAFIEETSRKGNMYTAIEREGRVVGIARVLRGDLEMKRHAGVFRTWLMKEAQGKGIGKKIMEYTLEWARRNDLHKVWLTVFSENEGAIYLYKKYGFVEEGVQKDQVRINGEYQDEIFMACFIDRVQQGKKSSPEY
jgi:RimJ/RimL family protein N-acetyltransferase